MIHRPDHRLSPRQRRKYLSDILDFQINCWLEGRGTIPTHRTITKARKAELRECFKAVDQEHVGLVSVDELGVAMTALGFSSEEVAQVQSLAICVDDPEHPEYANRIAPDEFMRLCIEAEAAARARGGSRSIVRAPGGDEFDSAPLARLIGSFRIRGLVDSYMRGDHFGASAPQSRRS